MRAVESDSVKSARKDKLHAARERVSETRERTLHRQEQNRMPMASCVDVGCMMSNNNKYVLHCVVNIRPKCL